jgi:hypothetical protein
LQAATTVQQMLQKQRLVFMVDWVLMLLPSHCHLRSSMQR